MSCLWQSVLMFPAWQWAGGGRHGALWEESVHGPVWAGTQVRAARVRVSQILQTHRCVGRFKTDANQYIGIGRFFSFLLQEMFNIVIFLYARRDLLSYYVIAHVVCCPSVRLSARPPVHLSVCLSVCPALAKSCSLINFKFISPRLTFLGIMGGHDP